MGASNALRGPDYFIFGSERGGTTLLSAMLSAHPDAYTLNDSFLFLAAAEAWNDLRRPLFTRALARASWVAKDLLRRLGPLHALLFRARAQVAGGYRPRAPALEHLPGAGHRATRAEACALLRRLDLRYRQYQPDEKQDSFLLRYADALAPARARAASGELNVDDLLALLFSTLVPAEQRDKARLGEKTPRHAYCAPWMRRVFPDARLVTLVRNPLANVAALHARMNGDLEGAIAKYRSFHGDACAAIYDCGVLVVRYEDVVHEPAATMSAIHAHLGLPARETTAPGDSTRAGYIGSAIDPERDRARMRYFEEADRARVLDACRDIVDRHYPDLDRFL